MPITAANTTTNNNTAQSSNNTTNNTNNTTYTGPTGDTLSATNTTTNNNNNTPNRDMASDVLDLALRSLPSVTALTSTCSIDLADDLIPLPIALRNSSLRTLALPLWFRHHWVLGSLHDDVLDIWDSAPSPHVKSDIIAFTRLLALRIGRPLRVRGRLAARQPYGSKQCGLHTVVRALLSSLGLSALLPNEPVVDWDALRSVLPSSSTSDPTPFTSAALVAAARPSQIPAAVTDRHIPHLADQDIRSTLLAAKTNHRFLVARHASRTANPSSWAWGTFTIRSHKRSTASGLWTPLLASTESTTLVTFPSQLFVFALAPLQTAPITWDIMTSDLTTDTPAPSRSADRTPSVSQPPTTTARLGDTTSTTTILRPATEARRVPATSPTRLRSASPEFTPRAPSPAPTAPTDTRSQSHVSATPDAHRPVGTNEETLNLLPAEVLLAASRFPQDCPSQLQGKDVTNLIVLDAEDAHVPSLALRALAPATASNHRQLLRGLAFLPRDLHDVALDKALVEWQCRLMKFKGWEYSTLHTRLASIAGALRLLPLYAKDRASIHMASSVVWSQASKAAAQKQRLTLPRRATPANWSDVTGILSRENHSPTSLAILLAWLTCGRMADVLRLKPTDIAPGAEYITVTFRDTKTRNPYTVATALPPATNLQPLLDLIEGAKLTSPLFKTSAPAVARALKAERQALTQHSLRRGALQTLARALVPSTALIHFSGHKTVASLLAYLDDGAVAPENPARAIQARILIGSGTDDDYTPLPPPSLNEIHACFPNARATEPPPRPPIHMKKVNHMDLDALLLLPMGDDTRRYLKAALRWVNDPALFEAALARDLPVRRKYKAAAFTESELEAMENYKFASAAASRPPGDTSPAFPVYGFTVEQQKAGRSVLRPIWEPTVNDAVADFAAQPLHLPTRATVLQHSTPSSAAPHIWCQLDGVSCFDQVPLHPSIRRFFTFVWRGTLQELLSLPMGFRRAVEVACAILWALLDFPRPSTVSTDSYVDNARFGGPTEEVVEAVLTFVRRAASVGYQLDHNPTTRAEVLAVSPTVDTFLGVCYDYAAQTRCISAKTLAKISAVGQPSTSLTHRQLACLIGLATWAGGIIEYPWHQAWHLLRRYAACAIAWCPRRRVTLSPKEHAELRLLLDTCRRNKPVPILTPPPPPVDLLLITDASKTGWGALAGSPGSTPTTLAGQWTKLLGSSVTAEPEGAWEALKAIQSSNQPKHVRLLTDHQPLVFAAHSGRAHAWSYNALLSRLATLPFHVSLAFLPGDQNPADAPSRGVALTDKDIEAFRSHVPSVHCRPPEHKPRFMT